MVVQGRVLNGVVVPLGGVRLPEGQDVTIVPSTVNSSTLGHSVLDIPTVSLGTILSGPDGDDLLGEMLADRL